MKMRQLASRPFIWLAVGALSVLIPTGPGCQAQTAGEDREREPSGLIRSWNRRLKPGYTCADTHADANAHAPGGLNNFEPFKAGLDA